jgi:putative sterol carrier protein
MTQADKPSILGGLIARMPLNTAQPYLKGITALLQLRATGDAPEEWILTIKDSMVAAEKGATSNPNLSMEASSSVWESVASGKLDGSWAYMSGQLHISGDLGLAMRLQSLIQSL